MISLLVILWFIIFVILLAVNIFEGSNVFGIIAGLWLLLLGIAIITTGLQIESGATVQAVDVGETIIEYTYDNATLPYGTYSFIWGIILILISIYIIYANAEQL